MNIAAYLSLVDTVTAELAKVRTKLELVQTQTRVGAVGCPPILVRPIAWQCGDVEIAFMPPELKVAFDGWLAVIGDKLNHPPRDDA